MNPKILDHMRKNLNINYVDGLNDLISFLPNGITMIEIGCYAGESTKLFLDSGKIKRLIAVDPYIDNYDQFDTHALLFTMDDVYKVFTMRILQNYENVTLLKSTSDAVITQLDIKEKVDFVYIDGNHQYIPTKLDILNFIPLIKKGGIIAGHDYNDAWASVKRAVNEIFGKPDRVFKDDSWMVQL
jgi:predicted O-methyltransferase YrrM